jgi:ribosomal protein S18 acetylase RimI-like enzyme
VTTIRSAQRSDLARLSRIWHDGWRDGHLGIVPDALARLRTLDNFKERLASALADTRVAITADQAAGFTVLKGDELYQFYVAAESRGSEVAPALMDDAETQLAARGVKTAWLACAIGNDRAARFYEKRGWRRVATITYLAETSEGPFPIENWRYEKDLSTRPPSA